MKQKIRSSIKLIALFVAILMVVLVISGCAVEEKVIGIAWRADTDSEFYTNIEAAIRRVGAKPVLLEQVVANYLTYDEVGKLVGCTDEVGSMTVEAADQIKTNLWQNTNVEEVMNGIDAVIFTGGEDISSSLFRTPEPWHGIEAEIDYNATRDASDYILMSYCIEKDVATVGFCRGMQMLAVVSGATMIQDIPTHFETLGLDYRFEHRNEKATPESYRDYVPHEVNLASGSLAAIRATWICVTGASRVRSCVTHCPFWWVPFSNTFTAQWMRGCWGNRGRPRRMPPSVVFPP